MRVVIWRPDELGETEHEQWRAWQQADPALDNPFLTPEFAAVYARHRPSTRVAVIEEGGATAGFFPFELHGRRVARSIGFRLADCQALVCAPDYFPQVHELLERCGIAVFEFDHIVHSQALRLASQPLLLASPVIDVRDGWESWSAAKKQSSRRVKRAFSKSRKLAREVGPLTFHYDQREHCELERLMEWKSRQYARTGRSDVLAQPWLRAFLHELLDTRTADFSVRLSRLDAGERTVARYLCTRSTRVLGSWFPTYDTELAAHSPGLVSVLSLVEAATADGITKVDLGKGHEDYKQSLKNHDDLVGQGVSERAVPAAVWRRIHQAPRRAAFGLVNRSEWAYRTADRVLRAKARLNSRAPGGRT
jgi:CelD/BcsL family acetyltransferase involved in cellulose biosynthesis